MDISTHQVLEIVLLANGWSPPAGTLAFDYRQCRQCLFDASFSEADDFRLDSLQPRSSSKEDVIDRIRLPIMMLHFCIIHVLSILITAQVLLKID